jgi:hypothetical protein
VVELPRAKSVVYRAPDWFLEIIPRAKGFTLRLAVEADELAGVADGVEDASSWNFILNSAVDGGSVYVVNSDSQLPDATALVKRAFEIMFG